MVPDRSDYTGFTTRKDGVYIYKTNSGKILYEFKDKEDCTLKANAIGEAMHTMYRIKQIEYESHLINFPQYYIQTYDEANWVHKCLYKGFKEVGYAKELKPYRNWFGCSLYSPDRILKRGDKTITLSLQGIYTRFDHDALDRYKEIFKECAVKYLCFRNKDEIVYETWTGKLPDIDFVEDFINAEIQNVSPLVDEKCGVGEKNRN
jgi:hypothetical protein